MQPNKDSNMPRSRPKPLEMISNEDLPRNPFSSSQFKKKNGPDRSPLGQNSSEKVNEFFDYSKTPSGKKSSAEQNYFAGSNSSYSKYRPLYYGEGHSLYGNSGEGQSPFGNSETQSRSLTPTHRNYSQLGNCMPALYTPRQATQIDSNKRYLKATSPLNAGGSYSSPQSMIQQKHDQKENLKESFQNTNPESITEYKAQNEIVSNRVPRLREKSASKLPPSVSPKNYQGTGNKSPANFTAGAYNGLTQGFYPGDKKAIQIGQSHVLSKGGPVYNLPFPLIQGNPKDSKRMINSQNLILMAKLNDFERAQMLLDQTQGIYKADVNFFDDKGWTSLHIAVFNGSLKLAKLLLNNHANINSTNNNGQTPLHICCQRGFEEMGHLLVNSGADVNQKDQNSDSSLHLACKFGHLKLVELLLSIPNIDWSHKNKNNLTPQNLTSDEGITKLFRFKLQRENPAGNVQQTIMTEMTKTETSSVNSYSNAKTSAGVNHDFSYLSEDEKLGPNNLNVVGMIGKGSFGEVYLVQKKDTKTYYAMKVIKKSQITNNNLLRYAMTERNVLSMSNFPFIVRLHGAFQSTQKLFMIMEFCPGGDLAEMLQTEKRFSEDKARIYLAEIVLAIQYLHEKDIIFRDLKPDNIVIDNEGHALLTDFGLSKEGVFEHTYGARSFCGSVAYLAPEMLKRTGHGKAVDWYLVGVILFEMLFGEPPFYSNSREDMFFSILNSPLIIPSGISEEARSLLASLLEKNPHKRLGSGPSDGEEIKQHRFFALIDWKAVLERKMKVQKPQRKIKIVTRIDPDIFDLESIFKDDEKHLTGWSFIEK